jgi:hypothetical protein
VRHIKETREAKTAAVDANAREAQHRAKADRLTQRCAELETQLAARDKVVTAAKDEAQQAGMAAAAEVERRLHEVSAEALASHLRKQLDMLQRTTSEVLAAALDGPARDAAYNSAAGVRAMSDLVDRAMTSSTSRVSGAAKPPVPAHSAAASFDLRRTVQGVRDLLVDDAKARGIAIDVEFAPNLPALVHGDDIEIRTAIMSLADAAVHAVADGTLVLRLSEEVSTAAHATIRCEVRHASARLKADALEAALAIKATDAAMPDAARQPLAYQAARAWRIIRGLQGQHGYLLPDEGGFSVWFTFTLGRPGTATSASLRAALAAIDESLMPLKQSAPAKAAAVSTASAEVRAAAPTSTPTAPLAVAAALGAHADATPARQMPRMPQELLTCNLGDVAELGADSMRVFCAKSPKGPDVTITFDDVEAGWKIRAEVTWSKKMAVRKHDVGLRFIGLTPEEQKRIQRIAMQHRKVVTMLDGDESR